MTTNNALQPVSSAELQEAIIALIRQNNTELKQLLADVLVAPKKQSKQLKKEVTIPPLPRLPYSELPFWKANPHLKAASAEGYGIKKEVFEEALAFFQDPNYPITDDWFDNLD
jgi:hypothetical protein